MIRLFLYFVARWHQLIDRFENIPSLGEFDPEDVCGECDCDECENGSCCDDCSCYWCEEDVWNDEDLLNNCDCEMCRELLEEPKNDRRDDDDDDWNHQLGFSI